MDRHQGSTRTLVTQISLSQTRTGKTRTRYPCPFPPKALGVRSGRPTAPSSSSRTSFGWTTTGSCCRSGQPRSTRTGQISRCWSLRTPHLTCSAMPGLRTPLGSSADSAAMSPASSASAPPTAVTPCGCRRTPTARGTFQATTHPTAHGSSSCVRSRGPGPTPTARSRVPCSWPMPTVRNRARSRRTASQGGCDCLTVPSPSKEGHPAGAGYQHPPPLRSHRRHVVDAFLAAARRGDMNKLLAVLDPGVVRRAVWGLDVKGGGLTAADGLADRSPSLDCRLLRRMKRYYGSSRLYTANSSLPRHRCVG